MNKLALYGIIGILGVLVGFGIARTSPANKVLSSVSCESKFRHLNNWLVCSVTPVIAKHEYINLERKISSYIDSEVAAGKVVEGSVYFRDLHNGPTMGINEDADFSPASLLKLPVLIAYLDKAQQNPDLLKKEIIYPKPIERYGQVLPPDQTIRENQPYTIEELLRKMVSYSDNASYHVLMSYMSQLQPNEDLLKLTYQNLGIVDPESSLDEVVTVKSYSSIFRLLYNSSILSDEMSEKALAMLAENNFEKGLQKGLPSNIRVADKFGERQSEGKDEKQLHDCGIVYYPENPYLLCVMTKGTDMESLALAIANISKMVYEEVDSRKIEK